MALAMRSDARRALVVLLATSLLGFVGCGECVFEQQLAGVVNDDDGAPLEGVVITTCAGERCERSSDDSPCTSATSDAEGRFSLEVAQCRPAAFQCELRPVILEREGCDPLVEQLALTTDEVPFAMSCP
jgi:hypothetical protein